MNNVSKKLVNRLESNTDLIDAYQWKTFKFWEKMFLYFWFASFIGQLYEVVFWGQDTTTIVPFAEPYGLGVVAVVIFVFPLIRKRLISPYLGYLLNSFVSSVVEYMSAVVVVIIYGKNIFWDYSNRALNLDGYICLESALLFGLLSTIFIYCIYPVTEKYFKNQNKKIKHAVFFATLLIYAIDLFMRFN